MLPFLYLRSPTGIFWIKKKLYRCVPRFQAILSTIKKVKYVLLALKVIVYHLLAKASDSANGMFTSYLCRSHVIYTCSVFLVILNE